VGGGRSTTSNRTRIKFVTDTLFLNEYQNDPMLQKYSVVIVDEAHERKIDTDIVFGIMKQCLRKRKDLKVITIKITIHISLGSCGHVHTRAPTGFGSGPKIFFSDPGRSLVSSRPGLILA
jgi:hypothetical protein